MTAAESFDAPLRIAVRREGNHYVVAVAGSADAEHAAVLVKQLEELRDASAAHLIFDFSELTFISSPGIGAIMTASRHARERHGSVRIAAANSNVARMLKLTHIDQVIPLHATLADAQAAAGKS